jgi:hypothetical protein
LRIEDTDIERSALEYEKRLVKDLGVVITFMLEDLNILT